MTIDGRICPSSAEFRRVAAADYGDDAALVGLSAARYHGAVPRARAMAWIATNVSRRRLDAGSYGRITFVTRKVEALDLVRARSELATGWVTSIDQTALDLMRTQSGPLARDPPRKRPRA